MKQKTAVESEKLRVEKREMIIHQPGERGHSSGFFSKPDPSASQFSTFNFQTPFSE